MGEYKMAEADVPKVEAAGGKKVDDMTDDEIEAAAAKSGVKIEELSDAEVAEADKAGG